MLVDLETLRPGCVLLQALGAIGNYQDLLYEFSDLWLLAPTPKMGLATEKISTFRKVFEHATKLKEENDRKKSKAL